MNGNTNGQNNNAEFFNFPDTKDVSEFCFSENDEFNLTFEELIENTVRDKFINDDLRKYYAHIKKNDANNIAFRDNLIREFKEYNKKIFENNLKHFIYLKLNYYEKLINFIYEYSLKALINYINCLGAQNVSTKEKMEAISKHNNYLTEKIISIIKRIIREKVKEKEKKLSNVKKLNKIAPSEDLEILIAESNSLHYIIFSAVREIFQKEGIY